MVTEKRGDDEYDLMQKLKLGLASATLQYDVRKSLRGPLDPEFEPVALPAFGLIFTKTVQHAGMRLRSLWSESFLGHSDLKTTIVCVLPLDGPFRFEVLSP